MSNIIRHKRSNTLGAVPSHGEFTEGEILLNTRDGKAFFKKVMPGSEEIVEIRGARDTVRATGQTGEEVTSETAVREAINQLSEGIIPNYFVTNLNEFLAAYNAIRANYAGGNIYVTGEVVMTSDLYLDLRGIEIIGRYCVWRHYNSTLLNPNPSEVYKIIITRGSPTFRGVTFYGSSGQSSLTLEGGTNRHIIELNTAYVSESITLTFDSCNFYDVVCGIGGVVISIAMNMISNAGVVINFNRCRVSTHNNNIDMTYASLQLKHTFVGTSTTNISVLVVNHSGGQNSNKATSLRFGFEKQSPQTNYIFQHDETAHTLSSVTETNSAYMIPEPASYENMAADGYIMITAGGTIYKVPASSFINYVSGGGYTHPAGFTNQPTTALTGLDVIRQIVVNNEGHVVGVKTQAIEADNYEKFRIAYESGQTNAFSDCAGANNPLAPGNNRGLKLIAGNNVTLSPFIDNDKLLNIVITASAGAASLYSIKALLNTSIAPIPANVWYGIAETRINADAPGTYLVNAQVHLYRATTGLSVIEARIYSSDGTVSSAETAPASTSTNRAQLHMSSIVVVTGEKFWFEIQVRTAQNNVWGIGGATTTTGQPGATQINIVKIA